MEKYAIIFWAPRTSRSVSQETDRADVMTVGNLRSYLEDRDEDDLVIINHQFTYGTLYYKDEGPVSKFE